MISFWAYLKNTRVLSNAKPSRPFAIAGIIETGSIYFRMLITFVLWSTPWMFAAAPLSRQHQCLKGSLQMLGQKQQSQAGKIQKSEYKKLKVISYSGKEFEISVVDEASVQSIMDELVGQKHIPFSYPNDGCYARAHEMARILEKKGIIVGKVYTRAVDQNILLQTETVSGREPIVRWGWHVAPIIWVEKGGKQVSLTVLDPSMFVEGVPLQIWVEAQTKHMRERGSWFSLVASKKIRLHFTERFVYSHPDVNALSGITSKTEDYDPEDIRDSEAVMKLYLREQNKIILEKMEE